MSPRARRWSWIVMGALVLVALTRAVVDTDPPSTVQDEVRAIGLTIKCPTCAGQSVAESSSPAAKAIKVEITDRVEEGQSADEIRSAIEGQFPDVLLTPSSSGIEGLVWILPVVVLVLAVAGIAAAFGRWRRRPAAEPTDADRALVDDALADR
jgi:cytochrome c-type biogenesis protein CcmH/NrfF